MPRSYRQLDLAERRTIFRLLDTKMRLSTSPESSGAIAAVRSPAKVPLAPHHDSSP